MSLTGPIIKLDLFSHATVFCGLFLDTVYILAQQYMYYSIYGVLLLLS